MAKPLMNRLPACGSFWLLTLAVAGGAGCSGAGTEAELDSGAWVGTVVIEGAVTTVSNVSGSVWGGPAELVEESSIGVLEGADEYMFGDVSSVWATENRILIVDAQLPAVRVYDWSGRHLFDVGRQGEGPGEFLQPQAVAVLANGNIVVSEATARLHEYSPTGELVRTYTPNSAGIVYWGTNALVIAENVPYKVTLDIAARQSGEGLRIGRRAVGPGAPDDAPELFPPSEGFKHPCLEYTDPRTGETDEWCRIPFAPFEHAVLTPDLDWVVGVSEQYSYDVHRADGSRLHVESSRQPVPVSTEQRDFERDRVQAQIRARDPGWVWSGPAIPDRKPAYRVIVPDRSQRLWVYREGPSRIVEQDCVYNPDAEEECWVADGFFDVFDSDGRYLGEIKAPPMAHFTREPFVRDNVFVAAVEDAEGTITVKRYRIALPAPPSASER